MEFKELSFYWPLLISAISIPNWAEYEQVVAPAALTLQVKLSIISQ